MLAMSEIVLESRKYNFWTNPAKTKHIWSLLKEIASIYSPIQFEIASISGPNPFFHCKHIWSLS